MTLILASNSPRRRELLKKACIDFICRPADIDETKFQADSPEELVRSLALAKASAVAQPGDIVLGADTVVVLGNAIFGKPHDMVQAASMLAELSGNTHRVLTGVALLHDSDTRNWTCCTSVTFKALTDDDIRLYHSLVSPLDKAGAYAIQEHGELIIDHIDGSLSNVIGLPMEQLLQSLETL